MKRQLMGEQWNKYIRLDLAEGCSTAQRSEIRRAFYAGAQALLMEIANLPREPTEEAKQAIEDLKQELVDFAEAVTQGRA